MNHETFMREAIRLAKEGMDDNHGGPFGAIVVKNGEIIGKGFNQVTELCDSTAHAEVMAIKDAAKALANPHLDDCVLYTSCQPCPMCLAAIFWAQIHKIFYAGTEKDAAEIGFDDAEFYKKMGFAFEKVDIVKEQLLHSEAAAVMKEWLLKPDRKEY